MKRERDPQAITPMQAVMTALDPLNLLNPVKVL
jgi:FAD/FMN-containing dehydrogenase